MQPGEPYYEVLRSWIAEGARLDLTTPRVTKIEVFPTNPDRAPVGGRQQLRVLATYASGEVRDVTREAFLESGNMEVAVANKSGLMTALRRGEAPILARYEGAYAATTLTVMGDRGGFRLDPAPGLRANRRAGRGQVEADEDPPVGAVHRRRLHPPRLARSDRPAARPPRTSARSWPTPATRGPSARHWSID